MQAKVIWTGLITDIFRVCLYYQAADMFILPSRSEGSPNVLAEAMTAGLPIIATRLPGITDQIITNGDNGLLFEENNADELVGLIFQLLSDVEKRKELGINARYFAMKSFAFEPYCRELENFYLQVFHAS